MDKLTSSDLLILAILATAMIALLLGLISTFFSATGKFTDECDDWRDEIRKSRKEFEDSSNE